MTPLQQLENWLSKEPNQTEVIIIRRKDNEFCVKIEYGNRTMQPSTGFDLDEVLRDAVSKADRLPSAKRKDQEKLTMVEKKPVLPGIQKKPTLPGL